MRPVQRHRRDHHIQARAVGQPAIDVRIALVHPPADGRHDALDHVHQMRHVAEARPHRLQLALALHVNGAGTVDDHIVHAGIVEQGLERPEAGDLVDHVENELGAFPGVERKPARAQHDGDGAGDLVQECGLLDGIAGDAAAVQIFQGHFEYPELHLLIFVRHLDIVALGGGDGIGEHGVHPVLARFSQCSSLTVTGSAGACGRSPVPARCVRKASL